jgi:hypothetical protein
MVWLKEISQTIFVLWNNPYSFNIRLTVRSYCVKTGFVLGIVHHGHFILPDCYGRII